MAINFYPRASLIGGVAGSLDNLDGADLYDLDIAMVGQGTTAKFYILDDDSGASESSPNIIAPDTNPGNKRWILLNSHAQGLYFGETQQITTHATGITISNGNHFVLLPALSSDLTGTGEVITETVDQNTVGIGGLLVLGSDGNWDDADKDAEATVGLLAIALETGIGSKKVLRRGYIRNDSWNWTPGTQLYVGDAGAITADVSGYTTGDFVQVIGYAKTADIIAFEPSPDYLEIA